MADFQYLPMERRDNGSYQSVLEQLAPTKLHSTSWLQEPAPLLLTPIIFSRIDNPCDYYFRKDPKSRDGTVPVSTAAVKDVITRSWFQCLLRSPYSFELLIGLLLTFQHVIKEVVLPYLLTTTMSKFLINHMNWQVRC